VQHKFRLGTDRREAERRDDRLRQFWEQICRDKPESDAFWDELTLEIAKQVARGEEKIVVSPLRWRSRIRLSEPASGTPKPVYIFSFLSFEPRTLYPRHCG
jgi:hypothetical protein